MASDFDGVTADLIALGVLVTAFAGLVTVHFALSYRLGRLGPPWRGLLAFLVPPLAPIWGYVLGLRLLPSLWMGTALTYGAALAVASV